MDMVLMQGNSKKQKYLIESMLSSPDVFAKCIGIVKSEYFDRNFSDLIQFTVNYFDEYHAIPGERIINTEFDIDFETQQITTDEVEFVCKEIETFCKEAGLVIAVKDSLTDIENKNYNAISERVSKALTISLDSDIGIEFFDNPRERLEASIDQNTHEPTGINALDKHLGGGLIRKQMTIFSANSGGGKSIMMNNIGLNFSHKAFKVVYISLELPQDMIDIRTASMWSNVEANKWMEHIPYMSEKIKQGKYGGGSFKIKRMPQGSCANDIRSYLKQYEIKMGAPPDLLIVDYLDLMSPNGGTKNLGISEQDKQASEQLTEILHQYNMFGVTASQQNREGIGNSAPDQSIVAGGLTKVNTTDNFISIYMDQSMRLVGKMIVYFLKTRSSSGVGNSEELHFDTKTLRISDVGKDVPYSVMPKRNPDIIINDDDADENEYKKLEIHDEKPNNKKDLLHDEPHEKKKKINPSIQQAVNDLTDDKDKVNIEDEDKSGLMSLMSSIHGGKYE